MTQDPTQAPEWFLDYDNCSLEEFRAFIEDRTGAAVKEKEILAAHLRKMDQTSTFPRFMELPPELRVNIYEALLVDDRARDERGWLLDNEVCQLHTAILRTSKLVYAEARPVLYDKNKFSVRIGYTWKWPCPREPNDERVGLRIVRPGAEFSYHRWITCLECPTTVEQSLIACPMLRGLRHLTVDLELVLPRSQPDDSDASDDSDDSDYEDDEDPDVTYWAHVRAFTAVCLALTGTSKMEELTIKVAFMNPQASDVDLAEVLWPLIFLRSDVVVKFEGISEVLQRETSPGYRKRARQRAVLSHRKKMAFAGLAAEVRKRCAERDEDIMELLDKLHLLRVWVDFKDIVNLTLKWTTLQRNADAFEGLNVSRRGHSGLRELPRT